MPIEDADINSPAKIVWGRWLGPTNLNGKDEKHRYGIIRSIQKLGNQIVILFTADLTFALPADEPKETSTAREISRKNKNKTY